jgi:hypothetical protein
VPHPPSTSVDAPPVLRLPRIRSLILGPDLAYRAHLIAVIGDLGPLAFATIAMAEHDDPADVLALVRYERPEVVVFDATGCESGVARVVNALAEASAAVGVVVVCEHSTATALRLGALPKWGWTQDLRSAVERAAVERRPRAPGAIAGAGPLAGWAAASPGRR